MGSCTGQSYGTAYSEHLPASETLGRLNKGHPGLSLPKCSECTSLASRDHADVHMPDSLEALVPGRPKSACYKAVLLPAGRGLFFQPQRHFLHQEGP